MFLYSNIYMCVCKCLFELPQLKCPRTQRRSVLKRFQAGVAVFEWQRNRGHLFHHNLTHHMRVKMLLKKHTHILINFIKHRHTEKHILCNLSESVAIVSWQSVPIVSWKEGLLTESECICRNSWMAVEARSLIGWTSVSRASASALRTRPHNFSISRRLDRNCYKEKKESLCEKWIHDFIQNLYIACSFYTTLTCSFEQQKCGT